MTRKFADQYRQYILILDIICLCLSFFTAMWARFGTVRFSLQGTLYGDLLLILLLSYIFIYNIHDYYYGYFQRGFYEEFVSVFRINLTTALLMSAIVLFLQTGAFYSRYFLTSLLLINIMLTYVCRQYCKIFLLSYYRHSKITNRFVVITTRRQAEELLRRMTQNQDWQSQIIGLVILDEKLNGQQIAGLPVIGDKDNLLDTLTKAAVDEVFLSVCNYRQCNLDELILQLENIGLTVNLSLANYDFNLRARGITTVYGQNVLTFAPRIFGRGALLLKRIEDIIGSLLGLAITIIVGIFVVPAILLESPGPFIFSQTRVGKNGRRFKIYKFRSMYLDAEKRKQELLAQNEMDGLMFKLKDDPRITRVGKFIRKTSIDELPQFINVLKGDMSLVGTRPPTEDEFLQYESSYKQRLVMRPGITGLWQVSGRSKIEKFEDVLKYDMTFINNWSIMQDIKILIKTVFSVLLGLGAE